MLCISSIATRYLARALRSEAMYMQNLLNQMWHNIREMVLYDEVLYS